jgi:hypothetical protein
MGVKSFMPLDPDLIEAVLLLIHFTNKIQFEKGWILYYKTFHDRNLS